MKVTDLRSLALEALTYPSYQHKDLPVAELDKLALKSFTRLPKAHKDKVFSVCREYGIYIDDDMNSLTELIRWRFLAQTNLFFLCKLLERYKDVSLHEYTWIDGSKHTTHEGICNEFFVRKDPTKDTFKQFAIEYVDQKQRLLLVPRGGFKSSIDMADTAQWLICWPETTLMILTGVLDLAKDFVKEIKSHFELDDSSDVEYVNLFQTKQAVKPHVMGDGTPSLFQVLFPEHCVPREDGKAHEFTTPASASNESSVFAASIDQNLSGWHVGVMKLDDVVTNENSRTIERIKNVKRQVSINKAMLHPYGFYDKIGTWYDSEDTYGEDMKYIAKCVKNGDDVQMKVYLRAAWWPNLESVKLGKIETEMVESDWELWFPEEGQLTYKFLKSECHDEEGFAIKYLNDPTKAHRIKFPRELLVRRTIASSLIPQQGMVVISVDTAYSTKSWADYTVILTALIYGGRFYIIDMKRGRYNEYELPQMIALAANQWKPKRLFIEDSVGVKWLGKEVYREMDKLRVRVPVEFVPLGQGSNKVNAKEMKAKPVLRLLGDERLLFTNQCAGLDELYNELEKFGSAASTHDDIVSALSILVDQCSSYAEMEGRAMAATTDFVADLATKQLYDEVYGQGVFSKVFTQKSFAASIENPEASLHEAVQQAQQDESEDLDPLAELFG